MHNMEKKALQNKRLKLKIHHKSVAETVFICRISKIWIKPLPYIVNDVKIKQQILPLSQNM
jgi:hypothetical protein